MRPVTIVGFRLLQARTAHVSPCTQSLVLLMKLYLLACLLAIASSAALESATKPTKKAAPKVDPVPLSTANTASVAGRRLIANTRLPIQPPSTTQERGSSGLRRARVM